MYLQLVYLSIVSVAMKELTDQKVESEERRLALAIIPR